MEACGKASAIALGNLAGAWTDAAFQMNLVAGGNHRIVRPCRHLVLSWGDGENPTDRKEKCFFVPVDEIKANNFDLSISRYKEIEYEQVMYDPPEKIITEIEIIEQEILKNLGDLKRMLKKGG